MRPQCAALDKLEADLGSIKPETTLSLLQARPPLPQGASLFEDGMSRKRRDVILRDVILRDVILRDVILRRRSILEPCCMRHVCCCRHLHPCWLQTRGGLALPPWAASFFFRPGHFPMSASLCPPCPLPYVRPVRSPMAARSAFLCPPGPLPYGPSSALEAAVLPSLSLTSRAIRPSCAQISGILVLLGGGCAVAVLLRIMKGIQRYFRHGGWRRLRKGMRKLFRKLVGSGASGPPVRPACPSCLSVRPAPPRGRAPRKQHRPTLEPHRAFGASGSSPNCIVQTALARSGTRHVHILVT